MQRSDKTTGVKPTVQYKSVTCHLSPVTSAMRHCRIAFTLMEMLVALSILVIMMGSIGEIFRIAGNASAIGQATLNVMANVRVAQGLMAQDFAGFNANGYLAIRQRWNIPTWQANYQYQPGDEVVATGTSYPSTGLPNTTSFYVCLQPTTNQYTAGASNTYWQYYASITAALNDGISPWRADQVAFLANGNFQSRTGDSSDDICNYLASNAAAIWYGQLWVSYGNPPPSPYSATAGKSETGYFAQNLNLSTTANMPPEPTGNDAGDFMLGREAILLTPQAGSYYVLKYYTDINLSNTSGITATGLDGSAGATAYITSSRLDDATITPALIMQTIASQNNPANTTGLEYIDNNYCYRFATVRTPTASEVDAGTNINIQLTNGYFRMMPILLQGVPSFAVDWTDGSSTNNHLNWYGLDNTTTSPPAQSPVQPGTANSDNYDSAMYAWCPGNKFNGTTYQWPLALRFTYTITDPANRMAGGRIISQIIYLPH
ncbi:MAG TPA: prepilin-type N-terminal cleavage/methylation domain-containing protein [Phycisphaerae bacterium]|nr:prepilin-type N-terminal cleavage/methylation domain-containing protein [Phycisphaerae bacterium]